MMNNIHLSLNVTFLQEKDFLQNETHLINYGICLIGRNVYFVSPFKVFQFLKVNSVKLKLNYCVYLGDLQDNKSLFENMI